MPLLSKNVTAYAVSNGRALAMTIPAAYAEEMRINRGSKLEVTFEPKKGRLVVSLAAKVSELPPVERAS